MARAKTAATDIVLGRVLAVAVVAVLGAEAHQQGLMQSAEVAARAEMVPEAQAAARRERQMGLATMLPPELVVAAAVASKVVFVDVEPVPVTLLRLGKATAPVAAVVGPLIPGAVQMAIMPDTAVAVVAWPLELPQATILVL